MGMIGDLLRQAREKKGLSLREIEDETNMRWKYLEALENEEFEVIPGETYVKGFLRNYSAFLGLDSDQMLDLYRERLDEKEKIVAREQRLAERQERKKKRVTTPGLYWIVGAVVGLGVIIGVWAFSGDNQQGTEQTPITKNNQEQAGKQTVPQAKPEPKAPTQTTPNVTTPTPQIPNNTQEPNVAIPEPPVTPGDGIVAVSFKAIGGESWFLVKVDGQEVFQGHVYAGQTKSFTGKSVWARVGDAGVVTAQVNGQDQGYLGEKGQVVQKEFTP